ncbi:MAG: hypothetical protein EPO10_09055 [Reyranella sp.]|nr:MAG: hypothetical protein EPO10_09055 [Reyranella sp.]
MDFAFSEDQLAIKDSVTKLCAGFDEKYWLKKDKEGGFPEDFYRAVADAGWLGIAMPEEFGGSGLGITEASIMMQAVAESGAALQGASAIHLNVFGPNPIVVFGTEEQKKRILPDIIKGKVKGCFARSPAWSNWPMAQKTEKPFLAERLCLRPTKVQSKWWRGHALAESDILCS